MDNCYLCGGNAAVKVKCEMSNGKRETGKSIQPKSALIILDGEINKRLLLKYLSSTKSFQKPSDSRFRGNDNKIKKNTILISADGASNILHNWKIIPDYIIGDLDSITPKAKLFFKIKKVPIKHISEQEYTDFEKCIKFALSKNIKDITVIGYGGKRSDHTLNNFSVMKRYYYKCRIKLIDEDFEIFFTPKSIELNCKRGDTVSLMAMPKAEGITTHGLQFPLRNEKLEFGIREGALNKATDRKVKIEFKKGDLLIFKKHS
jgi:thiamine pyrophosphokinase